MRGNFETLSNFSFQDRKGHEQILEGESGKSKTIRLHDFNEDSKYKNNKERHVQIKEKIFELSSI